MAANVKQATDAFVTVVNQLKELGYCVEHVSVSVENKEWSTDEHGNVNKNDLEAQVSLSANLSGGGK